MTSFLHLLKSKTVAFTLVFLSSAAGFSAAQNSEVKLYNARDLSLRINQGSFSAKVDVFYKKTNISESLKKLGFSRISNSTFRLDNSMLMHKTREMILNAKTLGLMIEGSETKFEISNQSDSTRSELMHSIAVLVLEAQGERLHSIPQFYRPEDIKLKIEEKKGFLEGSVLRLLSSTEGEELATPYSHYNSQIKKEGLFVQGQIDQARRSRKYVQIKPFSVNYIAESFRVDSTEVSVGGEAEVVLEDMEKLIEILTQANQNRVVVKKEVQNEIKNLIDRVYVSLFIESQDVTDEITQSIAEALSQLLLLNKSTTWYSEPLEESYRSIYYWENF